MKKYQVLLVALFVLAFSSSAFALGHFQKIDKCLLIYSEASRVDGNVISEGNGFLNLKNMDELIIKGNGFAFYYGKNSTTLYADKEETKQALEAFKRCSVNQ
jgi:hypothetical protein